MILAPMIADMRVRIAAEVAEEDTTIGVIDMIATIATMIGIVIMSAWTEGRFEHSINILCMNKSLLQGL